MGGWLVDVRGTLLVPQRTVRLKFTITFFLLLFGSFLDYVQLLQRNGSFKYINVSYSTEVSHMASM